MKRYIATMTVFVYAEDDKIALQLSDSLCDEINLEPIFEDMSIDKLHLLEYGKLEAQEIDIEKLRKD